jgi:hypothetical protein
MNGIDDDFTKRAALYKARAEAMDVAKARLAVVEGTHNILSALTVVIALAVLWIYPTIRWGIGSFVVLFVLRWIGNGIIRYKYVNPAMARLNRDYPAPLPRTHTASGRPIPGPGIDRIP